VWALRTPYPPPLRLKKEEKACKISVSDSKIILDVTIGDADIFFLFFSHSIARTTIYVSLGPMSCKGLGAETIDELTIDELIDTNPKCRLFFKIDLQEYFAVLICLSADEIRQPFSWGGNFYVDSGSWVTTSPGKNFQQCGTLCQESEIHMITLYFKTVLASVFNRNPHFLNLQDSHPLCIYHVYTHAKQTGIEGRRGLSERRLERQQY
jgi:hypothetical protein